MQTDIQSGGNLDFGMTDLEEQLAAEGGGAVQLEVLERLVARGQDLKAKMDAGLPSEDFKKAEAAYQALAAAHEIIYHFPANETGNANEKTE